MGPVVARADSPEVFRMSTGSSLSSTESNFRELDDVFLQTQTRIWLGEVLHTRMDEGTTIADLLADGELLFQVSKVIWKMLLTKCMELRYSKAYIYEPIAYGKGRGRYMPYSKVDSFLKICQILGLTSIDLFSPSDVVEKRDIRRVCLCIRSLSKKARSKHLNVPDFDIVTYTVVMPTDMVGLICRSLELSQCSSSSSASCSPSMESRVNHRQKNWGANYTRQSDSYSEESDDAESNFREIDFHSPDSKASCDNMSFLISSVENSPGGNSVIAENFIPPENIFHSDIWDQQTDGNILNHYRQFGLVESMISPKTYHQINDNHQLDAAQLYIMLSPSCTKSQIDLNTKEELLKRGGVRHPLSTPGNCTLGYHEDLDLGNHGTFVADSVGENTFKGSIDCQLDISDISDHKIENGHCGLFGRGKDEALIVYKDTACNERAAIPNSEYGLGRGFSDGIEDAGLSATGYMKCFPGKVVKLGFEQRFNAKDDCKSQILEHQNLEIEHETSNIVEHHVLVDGLTPYADKLPVAMASEDYGYSTKSCPQIPDTQLYSYTGDKHHFLQQGVNFNRSHTDADVLEVNTSTLLANHNNSLKDANVLRDAYGNQHIKILSGQYDPPNGTQTRWDAKNRYQIATISNGSNSSTPLEPVPPHTIYPNCACDSAKASVDALWLDDANFKQAGVINKVSSSTIKNNVYTRKDSSNCLSTSFFHEALNAELTVTVTATGSEKSCKSMPLGSVDYGGGLQQPNDNNISYCNGVEVHASKGWPDAAIGQECSDLHADGLNHFLKQGIGEGDDGCKNSLEARTVSNSFSTSLTITESEEGSIKSSLALSCDPGVNSSGVHAQHCNGSPLLVDISDQSSMILQTGLDASEDKTTLSVSDGFHTGELGSQTNNPMRQYEKYNWEMQIPVDLHKSFFQFHAAQEIQDSSDSDMWKANLTDDEPSFHQNSDVPMTLLISSSEKSCHSLLPHLEHIGRNQGDLHLIGNDLQAVDQTCINLEDDDAYIKDNDKDKEGHGIMCIRAVQSLERKEDKTSSERPGSEKSSKKLVLISVAGGITLFGALFLIRIRRSFRGDIDEASVPSARIRKTHTEQKQQRRAGLNGVYPREKLRF
ncbi:PREDICTED: uncharacterized protein LOC104589653 isoform X1 [Nelumbo nucifera]|uniref:Uncharacterized protein LOC104589653 isoform X1 n=1 Tax=Nelumbo nucifera TaxID=4432 RepID=A0A1U7Z062_NELNU|nr:PREDICTED: uncharacterized protein LOC104589653 isoform X1 [Nelumbo nucifera]